MSQYRNVFKDETKLDINYVPINLPHRETELRLLTEFLSFLLQTPEKMAQRIVITGDVGTGKTALSQRFGANVTHEAVRKGIRLCYVHINCREYRGSLFLVLQRVVTAFHPNFPRRGYSPEELLGTLMQILDEEQTYVVLALDEFESLLDREGSEAVYKLTRLQEQRQDKPQRLSLICILRNLEAIEKLDPSTRSTLQSNIIRLARYSIQQLADILNARVSLAFKPLTVPVDTVNLVADIALSENGNARFGIELLWRAGKYANSEQLDIVTPECVRKAVSSIFPAMRKSELAAFGLHEKLFLLGIAIRLIESQKSSVSLAEAENAYTVVCEEFEVSPNSHTQLWKYLRSLSSLGIVKTEVLTGKTRGRSTMIYLPRIPATELKKEVTSILEERQK